MDLSVGDLGTVLKATIDARTSWYNLGLELEVKVETLDDIQSRHTDPKVQLREMLKAWLRKGRNPTWRTLADAIKSPIVDEPRIAEQLEQKYCKGPAPPTELTPAPDVMQEMLQLQLKANLEAMQQIQQGLSIKQGSIGDMEGLLTAQNWHMEELQQQLLGKRTEVDDVVIAHGLQIHEIHGQLSEKTEQQESAPSEPPEIPGDGPESSNDVTRKEQIQLTWRVEPNAPEEMRRGTATVDGSSAYFCYKNRVLSYDLDKGMWSLLPECPQLDSSLVVVNGFLTAIGGYVNKSPTNVLLSLKDKNQDDKWSEQFPPMPTKRAETAAVYAGNALVVAGGTTGSEVTNNYLDTVEVLDTETLAWSTVCSLPQPLVRASATVCKDYLYILEGKYPGNIIVTCHLPSLIQSCKVDSPEAQPCSAITRPVEWLRVTDLPISWATCAAVSGHLLAVGGRDSSGGFTEYTSNVYTFDPTTSSWEVVDHMSTARELCLLAVLPGDELMVVGGIEKQEDKVNLTAAVEIARIT